MTPRPSQLDPYVPVSVHTAPDVRAFCITPRNVAIQIETSETY